MEILNEIDRLAEAIYTQCGLPSSVDKAWGEFGLSVQVQVRLVPNPDPQNDEHWRFFKAWGEDRLPRLRDDLADFILAHRKQEAA